MVRITLSRERLTSCSTAQMIFPLATELFRWAYTRNAMPLLAEFKQRARCVPILGYLDDLILIPMGIALAVKMVPPSVLAECRARVQVD